MSTKMEENNKDELKEKLKEIIKATERDLKDIERELDNYYSFRSDECDVRFEHRIYQILYTLLIQLLENYVEKKELDDEEVNELFKHLMKLKESSTFEFNVIDNTLPRKHYIPSNLYPSPRPRRYG